MKIGKMVFAAMFAIGLGSSCAYAQTASITDATTATFTAVVAKVDTSAGTISLTQILPTAAVSTASSPVATADYLASPVLLNATTVGATVQATVQRINGKPAVIALQTSDGVFSALPQVAPQETTASSSIAALTSPTLTSPVISDPARLTPAGIQ